MTNDDDGDDGGWGAFFGVITTFAVGAALVLAIGVGILLGYYVIGSGGNSSTHTTVVASTPTSTSSSSSSSSSVKDISSGSEIPLAPAFSSA
jgi:hypothetical protein